MIYNLGSVNIDHFYGMRRFPLSGETLVADEYTVGLGGKGANMSVAAARAGAKVCHIGAIGEDGRWTLDLLTPDGIDIRHVDVSGTPTGHASIYRDETGENTIVLFSGANQNQDEKCIASALSEASKGDICLLQNETNQQAYTARRAREIGMHVAYVAAPFSPQALQEILPYVDVLFLNEVEMAQLQKSTGLEIGELDVGTLVITKGASGCSIYSQAQGDIHLPALMVSAVDTTGAGDTFTGYFLAGLDRGLSLAEAAEIATAAAALMVTRKGTAEAIPDLHEVVEFGDQDPAKGA